jgi:gas vesicle protein
MAAKDTFEAFADIIKDKIDGLSNNASQQNMRAIQSELKDKFDDFAKSQGYVSNEEYEALKGLAKRLEQRVSKLEELLEESKTQ